MVRLSGIVIPDNKKADVGLTYVYGIGLTSSRIILRSANIDFNKKVKDLSNDDVSRIQGILDRNYTIEGNLRRQVGDNIKRLKEIGTWRGMRHARRLPVRGRTKTNSRTIRGNVRKTMGSGRKPTGEKT